MYYTKNYLFAAYLQTREGGSHSIVKVEKIKPGKAQFFFDISREDADALMLQFHDSDYMRFEEIRKNTINLAY